jgi:hypothetical protein
MTGKGWASANLRTQFVKLLAKADVTPWQRLFHSLRASRQKELEREHPTHVVCAWLGNSPKIATESYLLVPAEDFEKASAPLDGASNGARGGLKRSLDRAMQHLRTNKNTGKTDVMQRFSEIQKWRIRDLNP